MSKVKRESVKRMTEHDRLLELQAFVTLCFAEAGDYDLKELSNSTGLSYATVYRLEKGEFSLRVQFKTIQALGYAVGFRLEFTECSVRVALVS